MVNNLQARKDVLVAIAILIVAAFLTFYTHSNQTGQVERLKRQVKNEEEKTDLLLELRTVERKMQQYDGVLFANSVSDLLELMTRLTRKDYIQVESLEPDVNVGRDGVERIYVKASLYLKYEAIQELLEKIEGMHELLVIEDIHISKPRDYAYNQMLFLNIELYTIHK